MGSNSVNDRNFLQIVVDLIIIRIYYIDKQFYMCYVDSENIFPTMFKKAHKARDYLMDKLQDKKNIRARNKDFNKKKEYYKESRLKITRDIKDYDIWNYDKILERQEYLYNEAENLWK